jgi:hypothetical protein
MKSKETDITDERQRGVPVFLVELLQTLFYTQIASNLIR